MSAVQDFTPDFSLAGKVALLTGSARGIGLAIARALASAGCAVAIQDLEQKIAEEVAEDFNRTGGRAIALGGDILDLSLPKILIDQTIASLGRIDIVVNNASIQKHQHWLEMSVEEIERELRADLVHPLVMCQQVVPILKRQQFGRIINIGSIQGTRANPGMLPYSLAKTALEKLTMALARDLAKDQVTVNLIAPGFFDTVRNRESMHTAEAIEKAASGWVPLKRAGQPADCGGAALLLCSPAGAYITGQTLRIDGGLSA